MDVGASAAAGGSFFWPIFIFLLVAGLQLLGGYLDLQKKKGTKSTELIQLQQEIKLLLKEASSLSTPATFAQSAKLKRLAAAKEKELLRKQEEQKKEKNLSHELYARALLVLKVFFYVGLCWRFWGIPVAVVPQNLLQPFGSMLSWKSGDAAAGHIMVGVIPWLVLTSRVSNFFSQKLSKTFFDQ